MSYDQRRRYGRDKEGEDLVRSLASLYQLNDAVARDLLADASRAAAEDPYGRPVREWFGLLADGLQDRTLTPGKQTRVDAALGVKSHRHRAVVPGRITLTMRAAREMDARAAVRGHLSPDPRRGPGLQLEDADQTRKKRAFDVDVGNVRVPLGLDRRPSAAPVFRRATSSAQPSEDAIERLKLAEGASGHPLPEELARRLAQTLGPTVEDIRVHTDGAAAEAAAAIHADAFTVGRDVYFAAGAYDPASEPGQKLIAHEAAHAATQARSVTIGDDVVVSEPGDAHERDADTFAEAFAAGPAAPMAAPHASIASSATVHRRVVPEAAALSDEEKRKKRKAKKRGAGEQDQEDATRTAVPDAASADVDTASATIAVALPTPATPTRVPGDAGSTPTEPSKAGQPDTKSRAKTDTQANAKTDETRTGDEHAAATETRGASMPTSVEDGGTQPIQSANPRMGTATATGPGTATGSGTATATTTTTTPAMAVGTTHATEPAEPTPGAATETGEATLDAAAKTTGDIEFAPPDLTRLLPPPSRDEPPEQRAMMEREALAQDASDRHRASAALTTFQANGGQRVAELRSLPPVFDRELRAAETRAVAAITSGAAVQVQSVRTQVAHALAAARSEAAALRSQIESDYQATVRTIEESTHAARERVDRSRQTALDATNTAQQSQLNELGRLYATAEGQFRTAAQTAGGSATTMGANRAAEYRSHKIHEEDSFLDGHLTDNRCDAQAEAAEKVSQAYRDELVKEGDKQVEELRKRRPTDEAGVRTVGDEARKNLETAYQNAIKGLEAARTQSLDNARQSRTQLLGHVDSTLRSTVDGLGRHERSQVAALQGQATQLTTAIRQQRQQTSTVLDGNLKKAITGLEQGITALVEGVRGAEVPEPEALEAAINHAAAQLDQQIAQARQGLTQASTQAAQTLTQTGTQGVQALTQAGTQAVTAAQETASGARQAFSTIRSSASTSLRELGTGHQKAVTGNADAADTGFQGIVTGLRNSYQQLSRNFEQGAQRNADAVRDGLTAVVNRDLPGAITAEAQKARDQVQPRWKSVLKWVIIIAIVLVVAIVLGPMVIGAVTGLAAGLGASAAAAGVIGTVVGGALVGAATSAVTTVIDNAFAGRDLTTGLGMAIAMGALGGALGGAASSLLAGPMQGMTQLARFGLQVGVDVTLDTVLNIATGNFSWENFGTGLFMSVLTNGVSAHPRVHAAQQHYTSKGYGAGFEMGMSYSQRNVAQPGVSMPPAKLDHVSEGESYGPNSPNAGKYNAKGGHNVNEILPRANAEGMAHSTTTKDPITGVSIEQFTKPTGATFDKSLFPPSMDRPHIQAAAETGLQRALTGAPGTTHTPPTGNQNGKFTATVVTPDGHPIIIEGFYKLVNGVPEIQTTYPQSNPQVGSIPVVPGSRDVRPPGYATPPDFDYGDEKHP